MRGIFFVVVVLAAATAWAFRPELAGTATFWVVLGVPYALLASVAVYRMWRDGNLLDMLGPRWGDLSIGALVGATLLVGSWIGRTLLTSDASARQSWLLRVYLQLGDADAIQRSLGLTSVILLLAVCEELVWRGWVLVALDEWLGPRKAPVIAVVLYVIPLVPTIFLLADPLAGPNPVLVLAGLGCGIVWTYLTFWLRRLPPVIISHMAFTYFTVAQFRWPWP